MSSVLVSVVTTEDADWSMTYRDKDAANFKECFVIEKHGEFGQKIIIPNDIIDKLIVTPLVKAYYRGV